MTTTVLTPTATTEGGALPARAVARAVDGALLAGAGLALGSVIGFGPVWLVLNAAGVAGWFVGCDVLAGATPGKRLLGLRVVGADGDRPTLREAAVREAFVVVGAVPFVGPVLALGSWTAIALTIRSSPTGRGVHDRLAGGTAVATR